VFQNSFAANNIRTLSKNLPGVWHRETDPVFPFYSPRAILPPNSGGGSNHHETYSLL
jgi:hypothetical protein